MIGRQRGGQPFAQRQRVAGFHRLQPQPGLFGAGLAGVVRPQFAIEQMGAQRVQRFLLAVDREAGAAMAGVDIGQQRQAYSGRRGYG